MHLLHFFTLLFLANFCHAGPLVILAGVAADVIVEAGLVVMEGTTLGTEYAGNMAAWAVYGTQTARIFGVAIRDGWYGEFVIYNGALFHGSTAAVGATLAAEGGAIGAGVAVTDKKKSAELMHSIASEVKSSSSVHAELSKYGANTCSAVQAGLTATIHGMTINHALDPFTFASGNIGTRSIQNTYSYVATGAKSAATTTIPPPPAAPVGSVLPAQRPSEVPAGVPKYIFRMCQFDIMRMRQNNKQLIFDISKGSQSVRVDNIPSTCMVLSNFLTEHPALGPHPVPMGAASLQWNGVDEDGINFVRKAFGLPPISSTAPAAVASGK